MPDGLCADVDTFEDARRFGMLEAAHV